MEYGEQLSTGVDSETSRKAFKPAVCANLRVSTLVRTGQAGLGAEVNWAGHMVTTGCAANTVKKNGDQPNLILVGWVFRRSSRKMTCATAFNHAMPNLAATEKSVRRALGATPLQQCTPPPWEARCLCCWALGVPSGTSSVRSISRDRPLGTNPKP